MVEVFNGNNTKAIEELAKHVGEGGSDDGEPGGPRTENVVIVTTEEGMASNPGINGDLMMARTESGVFLVGPKAGGGWDIETAIMLPAARAEIGSDDVDNQSTVAGENVSAALNWLKNAISTIVVPTVPSPGNKAFVHAYKLMNGSPDSVMAIITSLPGHRFKVTRTAALDYRFEVVTQSNVLRNCFWHCTAPGAVESEATGTGFDVSVPSDLKYHRFEVLANAEVGEAGWLKATVLLFGSNASVTTNIFLQSN